MSINKIIKEEINTKEQIDTLSLRIMKRLRDYTKLDNPHHNRDLKKLLKLTKGKLPKDVEKHINQAREYKDDFDYVTNNTITNYKDLADELTNTKLYKFLDKKTEVIYREVMLFSGDDGGGLRLRFKEDDLDYSLNNFNKRNTENRLKSYIDDNMTDDIKKELKLISRITDFTGYRLDWESLIYDIIDQITNRPAKHQSKEDLVEKWFDKFSICTKTKKVTEYKMEEFKEFITNKIIYSYPSISRFDNIDTIVSKLVDNCR